jgi:hypothetical protein
MCRTGFFILCLYFTLPAFSMDFEEWLTLKSFYTEKEAVVEQKINEIDQRILNSGKNPYLYLAKATLLTILASDSTLPDPHLAERMINNINLYLNLQPTSPYGIMYKGTALGYKAKTSSFLFDQLSLIGEASSNYDRAMEMLESTPYEWWGRSLRGSSYAQFPLALGKRSIAMADLTFVEKEFDKNPRLIGEAVVAFYYLGEINASMGRQDAARKYWKRAADLNRGSGLSEGRKAEARIAKN